MNRSILAVVVLSTLSPQLGWAQSPGPVTSQELQNAVAALGQLAGTLKRGVPPPSKGSAPSSASARFEAAVKWLQNNAPKSDPALVTREYVQSLQRATALLQQSGGLASVAEDVTRELEAKVTHCKLLGVGMGGSVGLQVNTRRAGAVVGDWQVQYLLKFDDWLKTPPRTFPRVSSPTSARVEPGRYWIWARDPATGRTSDRVLVEVAGRTDLLVDLPVP